MRLNYLDYNATTPIAPEVREAMLPYLAEHYGNPSSSHVLGRACHEAVEQARERVAHLLGASSDEIVFTSGGTEANNLALKGVMFKLAWGGTGHLVISTLEHPAIVEPARFLERLGYEVSIVPCDRRGVVDPADVQKALRPQTVLVSIMHANNEIGTLQPIAEISRICRQRGVLVHTDAAQSIGKVRVKVQELGVDLLTIAGHKLYAPKGVGALYVRLGVALEPLLHGAGHERGLRAGTENVPYLVGLGRAAMFVEEHESATGGGATEKLARLRDRLYEALRTSIAGLTVNGAGAPRLPNTLSVNFPGAIGGDILKRCPELCASTGAACHSGSTHVSATLKAIGLAPEVARGTVRLSVGWPTTDEEIDRAARALVAAWEACQI
jgi:cysteine desulfurase